MRRTETRSIKLNKSNIKSSLVHVLGGGVCRIHGEYIGIGKHGLKTCPICDIEAYYIQEKQTEREQ